tara:strand:+ start:19420 stop:20226 length:807 start_codon:yes stop_codon:yes gene_type:complete
VSANKDSSLKPKMHKLDGNFHAEMAFVLEMGDKKYGLEDWKHGMEWSELVDSAERHIKAMKENVFIDSESKRRHTAHVGTCMMMLDFYIQNEDEYGSLNNLGISGKHIVDGSGQSWANQDVAGPIDAFYEAPISDQLNKLQDRIFTWADSVFPQRTAEDALKKLIMEEIPELLTSDKADDPLEWADVFILMLDVAKLKGIDLIAVSHEKMAINENRTWEINDKTGLMNHVPDDAVHVKCGFCGEDDRYNRLTERCTNNKCTAWLGPTL